MSNNNEIETLDMLDDLSLADKQLDQEPEIDMSAIFSDVSSDPIEETTAPINPEGDVLVISEMSDMTELEKKIATMTKDELLALRREFLAASEKANEQNKMRR